MKMSRLLIGGVGLLGVVGSLAPGTAGNSATSAASARPSGALAGWGPNAGRAKLNQRLATRIFADRNGLAAEGARPGQWGPDAETGKVKVYLGKYSASAARALYAKYGSDIVVATTSAPEIVTTSRRYDVAPYYGGDWITSPNHCTSGPTVHNSSGQKRMLLAAHCANTGQAVVTDGLTMGTVQRRKYGSSTSYGFDAAIVDGSYAPYVYGGGTDGSTRYCQAGGKFVDVGEDVANDGAVGDGKVTPGEVRHLRVNDVHQYVTEDDGHSKHLIKDVSLASRNDGSFVVAPGDSGAPVIQHEGGNPSHVKVAGIVIGTVLAGTISDVILAFQEIKPVASAFNITVVKKCS